jgi:hypothetical protein
MNADEEKRGNHCITEGYKNLPISIRKPQVTPSFRVQKTPLYCHKRRRRIETYVRCHAQTIDDLQLADGDAVTALFRAFEVDQKYFVMTT